MTDSFSANNSIEQIWKMFHAKLKSIILAKVKDEALVEDILQEVFIKIHRQSGQLRDENKLQAWVYQVTRNAVYDHFRMNNRQSQTDVTEIEAIEEATDNQYMSETIEDMVKMMSEMPADYCDVLCSTELEGMSHKDYADKKGITLTAAKTRAFRARNMLKDMLMKCCHYQFDRYGTVVDIQPAACCCCCGGGCL
jgi:RNA polymerase sigma-70 factor, ECF subfamily